LLNPFGFAFFSFAISSAEPFIKSYYHFLV
jgi:hypothetical protein